MLTSVLDTAALFQYIFIPPFTDSNSTPSPSNAAPPISQPRDVQTTPSGPSQQPADKADIPPEVVEKNKSYLKSLDNYQVRATEMLQLLVRKNILDSYYWLVQLYSLENHGKVSFEIWDYAALFVQ